jgi:hypothetical protein
MMRTGLAEFEINHNTSSNGAADAFASQRLPVVEA